MKRAKLICLCGIDGSGKTTISKSLVKLLNNNNMRACYVYGRIVPLITRLGMYLGRKLILKCSKEELLNEYTKYEEYKKTTLKKSKLLILLFKYTFLLEQLIQVYIKLIPKLFRYDYIVLDRYIYDTIITDISPNLDMSTRETLTLIKRYSSFTPKPDMVILVDVPEEVAYNRKNDVPHPEYLKQRRRLYLEMFKALKDDVHLKLLIDGTDDLRSILEKLQKKILNGGRIDE